MAVVVEEARLVFVAEAHTAGRSTARALETLGGRPSAGHHDSLADVIAQGLLTRAELDAFTVVSTVRNHYDALVTWWLHRGRGRAFVDFLRLLVVMPGQLRDDRLYWRYFDDSDVILRFEGLPAQLSALVESRAGAPLSLPHLGDNRKGDYRSYYDDTSRALVEQVFAGELHALGYGFEPCPSGPPLQRTPAWRAHGGPIPKPTDRAAT